VMSGGAVAVMVGMRGGMERPARREPGGREYERGARRGYTVGSALHASKRYRRGRRICQFAEGAVVTPRYAARRAVYSDVRRSAFVLSAEGEYSGSRLLEPHVVCCAEEGNVIAEYEEKKAWQVITRDEAMMPQSVVRRIRQREAGMARGSGSMRQTGQACAARLQRGMARGVGGR